MQNQSVGMNKQLSKQDSLGIIRLRGSERMPIPRICFGFSCFHRVGFGSLDLQTEELSLRAFLGLCLIGLPLFEWLEDTPHPLFEPALSSGMRQKAP